MYTLNTLYLLDRFGLDTSKLQSWTDQAPHIDCISVLTVRGTSSSIVNRANVICVPSVKLTI